MPTRPTKTGPSSGKIKANSKAEAEAMLKKATTKRPDRLKKPKTDAAAVGKKVEPPKNGVSNKHVMHHNIPGLTVKYKK